MIRNPKKAACVIMTQNTEEASIGESRTVRASPENTANGARNKTDNTCPGRSDLHQICGFAGHHGPDDVTYDTTACGQEDKLQAQKRGQTPGHSTTSAYMDAPSSSGSQVP